VKVLVTGAGGQVGRALVRLGPDLGVDVVGLDRSALDITDAAAVREAVASLRPDAVVNAAAYTAVDRAEAEPGAAYAVNRDAAGHLAEAAESAGVPLVHVSTDYVFDGTKGGPYAPDDPVAPLNVYGASKAAGEEVVRAVTDRAVILRTAWVFEGTANNFVTTMLRLATERPRLTVVADQWGHPTPAADVARGALAAARRAADGLAGTVHFGGLPLATWHDLATVAVDAGHAAGLFPLVPIDPVPTEAYPTAARRPQRVEFDQAASLEALGLGAAPDWRNGLVEEIHRRLGF
jgi:dTDP-4-dehydrorhamnose reductase